MVKDIKSLTSKYTKDRLNLVKNYSQSMRRSSPSRNEGSIAKIGLSNRIKKLYKRDVAISNKKTKKFLRGEKTALKRQEESLTTEIGIDFL